ncbi:hypothetical protein HYN48_03560 [Flavobacterium magnum]|uniref:Uncharacterized protein n=1 Tax=Flavobacterium magnum TaxID=2162713 RepID=A0A2S0RDA6_9FLAO|nr:hypothetical protein [Flavobacterium magnum]AWA29238.1 hypothetical protein HYN48_03560 [Flavobacterium magnum]
MSLTSENIEFIDNYLKHSNVIYADIRSEMTDHIATAVEAGMTETGWEFLTVFKEYMAKHKKELMKMNNRSQRFSMDLLKHYFSFLTKPWMIFFGFVNFFLLMVYFRIPANDFQMAVDSYTVPLIWLLIILLPQLIVYMFTRKRFYYIERNGFLAAALYQISLLLTLISAEVMPLGIAWCSYVSIGYILYILDNLRQFYTNKIYLTSITK